MTKVFLFILGIAVSGVLFAAEDYPVITLKKNSDRDRLPASAPQKTKVEKAKTARTMSKAKKKKRVLSVDLTAEAERGAGKVESGTNAKNAPKGTKNKPPQKRLISGPSEVVQVPDGVQWDHHRKLQEKEAKELNEGISKELTKQLEE